MSAVEVESVIWRSEDEEICSSPMSDSVKTRSTIKINPRSDWMVVVTKDD
jgi:hypothetical protein